MITEFESSPEGRQHAPGSLGVVQDFINTRDVEGGSDELARPALLAAWLETRRLAAAHTVFTEQDLARAKALREALRELLLVNTGEPVDPAALEALNRYARAAPLVAAFDAGGVGHLEPLASGADAAFGRLLAIVVTAMTDGSWARLKSCRAHSCRWAFYDASKNRSGSWCSMAVCGNRTKVRAYQRRRKRAAGGSRSHDPL